MSLIHNSDKIQGIFSSTDPNTIAKNLKTGLNNIAETLSVRKKIQREVDEKNFDDQELRQAIKEIKY